MIFSMAHAPVDDATATNLFGAWSNMVVGSRPNGLVDCYLLKGDDLAYVVSVWASLADHEAAISALDATHPAITLFNACGIDPGHTVYEVMGHLRGS